MVDASAENDDRVDGEHRIAQCTQLAIEKWNVPSHVLLRVGIGNGHKFFVEQIINSHLAACNGACEALLDLLGHLDRRLNESSIDGWKAGICRHYHDALTELENILASVGGRLQGRIRCLH